MACERACATVSELQKAHVELVSGRSAGDRHRETVQAHMEELQQLVAGHGERHTKEMDALRQGHVRLAQDHRAREADHTTIAQRLEQVESALADHADRHARELSAAHMKCDHLHARLSEDRAAHEAHVRSLIANEKEVRDSHTTSLRERVDILESTVDASAQKYQNDLEVLKNAHSKHACEAKARETSHASMTERIESLERVVNEAHSKLCQDVASSHMAFDQVHRRVLALEKHMQQLDEHQRCHSNVSSEKAAHISTSHVTLTEKVEYLERLVGDSAEKHTAQAMQFESARAAHSIISGDLKAHAARQASIEERLKFIERLLDESAEKHARELSETHAHVEDLHGRLASCEAHGSAIDSMRRSHGAFASEQLERAQRHTDLAERLECLERLAGDSAEKRAREMRCMQERLDELQERVRQAAREVQSQQGASRGRDGEATQALLRRLEALESSLAASTARLEQTDQKVSAVAQTVSEQASSLSEHLGLERQALEAQEREVKASLARERSAREVHEGTVADRFDHERGARERHQAILQEAIGREREERAKQHTALHEELQRRSAMHDARHQELQDLVARGHAARAQHDAPRAPPADAVSEERAERIRHDSLVERVDSLQRTVNIFDSVIRKEIDERTNEYTRIWDAIDNHTHDLSAQVITERFLPSDGPCARREGPQWSVPAPGPWRPSMEPSAPMPSSPLRGPARASPVALAPAPVARPVSPGRWHIVPCKLAPSPHLETCGPRYAARHGEAPLD